MSVTFSYPVPSLTVLEALQVASTGQIVRESNGALIANTEANRPLGALDVVWNSGDSVYVVTPPAGSPDGDYQFFVYLSPTWADDEAAVGQSNVQNNDGGEYVDTGGDTDSSLLAAAVWSYGQRSTTAGPETEIDPTQRSERTIIKGNSYGPDDRSFLITIANGGEWPTDLDLYEWTLFADKRVENGNEGSDSFESASVDVETATGSGRAVHPTITSEVTSALATGLYKHSLRGELIADDTRKWTIELGTIEVLGDPAEDGD